MTKAKHGTRFETKLPQHEGSPHVYFVHDCKCGWISPLCQSAARAHDLYIQHSRKRKPR